MNVRIMPSERLAQKWLPAMARGDYGKTIDSIICFRIPLNCS